MVDYRIRDELMNLIVCLYNPQEDIFRFTTDTLQNYILDCGWQVEHRENPKRIPFYITPSKADAEQAINDMRFALHEGGAVAISQLDEMPEENSARTRGKKKSVKAETSLLAGIL